MDMERTNNVGIPESLEETSTASPANGSTNMPSPLSPSSSQVEQVHKPLEKVLAMGKGDDEASYSKNSAVQDTISKVHTSALTDALARVALPSDAGRSVVVAELGSSSGPNSIGIVAFIVDKLRQRVPKDAEFQAYFNDLPSNDFNNLFQLLTTNDRTRNFLAAGVPGSFFYRLFARSSVHVFSSSACLHWLSKVPDEVADKDSLAYNSGHTWIYHSCSAVARAYQQQALLDLKNFLVARAVELVPGGLLFFNCEGRTTSTEPNKHSLNDGLYEFCEEDLNGVWSELIAEGLLTGQQRDTFNVPIYLRSIEDVRQAIASCGPLFDVLTAKLHRVEFNVESIFGTTDPTAVAKKSVLAWKAVMNPLFEAHVGKKLAEVTWERYAKVVEKRVHTKGLQPCSTICIIGLIRK